MEAAGITRENVRRESAAQFFFTKEGKALDHEKKAIRFGLAIIACTLALKLITVTAGPAREFLAKPEVASLLVYLQTGRKIKLPQQSEKIPLPTQAPTVATLPEEGSVLTFAPEDAGLVTVSQFWEYPLDMEALLQKPLQWDLTGDGPKVLILHSHATESYTKTEGSQYVSTAAYRTMDTDHNMIRVGEELKQQLEAMGISVIHDTTLHDHPSYTDAYINSRETVEEYLARYPQLALVLDLHRDATDLAAGPQLTTAAMVDGKASAQLMLVVGTDKSGRTHPNWEENMALAVKLHARLQQRYPGICRPINFRTERFNQDLLPGALLVEVGAAGDTLDEALAAVGALAAAIGDLAKGAITANSTS